jgi:2-keto-3-deoxy-L-rhamnonate aldolase RhmA
MDATFKSKLIHRERLAGTILTLPSPELAEICAQAGFDWLWLDMEHGSLGLDDVQHLVQAVAGRTPCIVRLPLNEEVWFKKVLDIGVSGLLVPQVSTVEQAERAVRFSKYPPQGTRSVGVSRAAAYGPGFQAYIEQANPGTSLIVQIETIQAVENVAEILAVPGLDAVLIGPFDLSASMGKIGQVHDPDVVAAIQRVRQACAARQFPLGIFSSTVAEGLSALQNGFSFTAVSNDVMLFSDTVRQLARQLSQAVSPEMNGLLH